ncbi:MAG: Do family serine endopeptidase [Bacteroidales bacterium]
MKKYGIFIITVLVSVILAVAIQQVFFNKPTVIQVTQNQLPIPQIPVNDDGSVLNFRYAVHKSVDAVVHVKTSFISEGGVYRFSDPFYDFFFGPQYKQPEQRELGIGSGVILSSNGYIVTNNHVIDKANYIEVLLNDQRTFKAIVVGVDKTTDIALLKIEAADLPFLTYGNSDALEVGDWVIAVGNPFNLNSTVTAGIVSAKARNLNILSNKYAIESFIQTDAAVNPGNSGGALVNIMGELVGINTAIASKTGSFTGYSFAIPSVIVKKIVSDLIEFGKVQRAYLGVNIVPVDGKIAQQFKMTRAEGLLVSKVLKSSAAEQAGIQENDIILTIEDNQVNTFPQLQEQISRYRPGDEITVTILRDGKQKRVNVKLLNMYGNTNVLKATEIKYLGATFEEINSNDAYKLRIQYGMKIIKLEDGVLSRAGIREGYIITSINRRTIQNSDDLADAIETSTGALLIEGVYPNGIVANYLVRK